VGNGIVLAEGNRKREVSGVFTYSLDGYHGLVHPLFHLLRELRVHLLIPEDSMA
jgi:hypothetical protein